MTATDPTSPAPFGRRPLLAAGLGIAAAAMLPGCAPTAPPGPVTPTRPAGAAPGFVAVGGYLLDPDDHLFAPLGANVGTTGSFDWKGDSRRHAADALDWGWNTVRLNLLVTPSASWSYVASNSQDSLLGLVSSIVAEYTAAGIVVIIDAHDNPKEGELGKDATEAGLAAWWSLAAHAFKDNPRVWCGLLNEPAYANDEWLRIMDTLAGAVRSTGNQNPILVGAPAWGQDVGHTQPFFADTKFSYEPTMAPVLQSTHGNLILEQHNFGAYGTYATPEKLTAYLGAVRGAGLTPLIGEFGYTRDGTSTAGDYQSNYDAAQAVFAVAPELKVGALWWHATHGDNYSLTTSGEAFWTGKGGQGLSDGGTRLWGLGHPGK
jgi:hypothetical protein